MHTLGNTRNGESLHLDTRLRGDLKTELLREKVEIERRLRAIEEALKLAISEKPRRS